MRATLRIVLASVLATTAAACAAESKTAPSAEARSPSTSPAYGYGQSGYPAQPSTPGAYPPPAPPPPPQPGAQPGVPGTSRSMALQSAASEVESSQRELDVAAGDCRNACRALGSMDRAAGEVCKLAAGEDEGRRCDDAKKRVYSARDRVKTTCGTCPGGVSVERADPIPSSR